MATVKSIAEPIVNTISKIDLHIHTTASDGTFTPTEVVNYALKKKLKAIAITDHDSVNGIGEALIAAQKTKLEVIPGIEFSTELNEESIHVLGLFINYKNKELLSLSNEITNAREIRAGKMIEKINALNKGPELTLEEVKNAAKGLIGRPHIAEVMIKKGYGTEINEIFDKFISRGAPCYVPRFKLTPQEAIEYLIKFNAIPIIAHPGYITAKFDLEIFFSELKEVGLGGIEVYYPSHSKKQIKYFKHLAKKLDLLISGGSDCHGKLNSGPFIGTLDIHYDVLQKMKNRYNIK